MWASRLWHGHFMRGDHRPSASHDATATGTATATATATASRIPNALPTATGTAAAVEGPLSPRVGRRFRKLVLERGNAAHARVLLTEFLDDEGGGGASKGVRDLEKVRRSENTSDSTDVDFAVSVDQWVRADIEGEGDRPSLSSLSSSSSPSARTTL